MVALCLFFLPIGLLGCLQLPPSTNYAVSVVLEGESRVEFSLDHTSRSKLTGSQRTCTCNFIKSFQGALPRAVLVCTGLHQSIPVYIPAITASGVPFPSSLTAPAIPTIFFPCTCSLGKFLGQGQYQILTRQSHTGTLLIQLSDCLVLVGVWYLPFGWL